MDRDGWWPDGGEEGRTHSAVGTGKFLLVVS